MPKPKAATITVTLVENGNPGKTIGEYSSLAVAHCVADAVNATLQHLGKDCTIVAEIK